MVLWLLAFSISDPILAGLSVTIAPARSRADTLSAAAPARRGWDHSCSSRTLLGLPLPPEMIAPACPMRLPGGAVRPAINATTGLGFLRVLLCCSKYSAASSSIEPPISPMMTMPDSEDHVNQFERRNNQLCSPSVLSSSKKTFTTSTCCVPGKGSPPMPTQSDCPKPASVV